MVGFSLALIFLRRIGVIARMNVVNLDEGEVESGEVKSKEVEKDEKDEKDENDEKDGSSKRE